MWAGLLRQPPVQGGQKGGDEVDQSGARQGQGEARRSPQALPRYLAFFWWKKLYEILNTKTQRQLLEETLERAQVYEEWEGAALHLDAATGNQLWRESPQSKDYDCNLIHVRVGRIEQALEEEDLDSILRVLRNGLVRNIGNITIPKLYNRAYAGTKVLIEDYVTRVAET
ncbi:hypothetical protein KC315_g19981, partial [Hortaea werneckii]